MFAALIPVLFAAAFSGPVLVVLGWILLAASVLNTIMSTMLSDLTLRENGCPEAFSTLLFLLTAVFFFLPKFVSAKVVTLALSIYSGIVIGGVKAASTACTRI